MDPFWQNLPCPLPLPLSACVTVLISHLDVSLVIASCFKLYIQYRIMGLVTVTSPPNSPCGFLGGGQDFALTFCRGADLWRGSKVN